MEINKSELLEKKAAIGSHSQETQAEIFDSDDIIRKLKSVMNGQPILKNLTEVIDNSMVRAILDNKQLFINTLLIKELNFFISFEKNMKRRKRIKANFDLIRSVIEEIREENASVLGFYVELSKPLFNRYNYMDKKRAIKKYRAKRDKRKDPSQKRYRQRKELANKRLRHRGKFIKKPKLDLEKIAKEFEKEKSGFLIN